MGSQQEDKMLAGSVLPASRFNGAMDYFTSLPSRDLKGLQGNTAAYFGSVTPRDLRGIPHRDMDYPLSQSTEGAEQETPSGGRGDMACSMLTYSQRMRQVAHRRQQHLVQGVHRAGGKTHGVSREVDKTHSVQGVHGQTDKTHIVQGISSEAVKTHINPRDTESTHIALGNPRQAVNTLSIHGVPRVADHTQILQGLPRDTDKTWVHATQTKPERHKQRAVTQSTTLEWPHYKEAIERRLLAQQTEPTGDRSTSGLHISGNARSGSLRASPYPPLSVRASPHPRPVSDPLGAVIPSVNVLNGVHGSRTHNILNNLRGSREYMMDKSLPHYLYHRHSQLQRSLPLRAGETNILSLDSEAVRVPSDPVRLHNDPVRVYNDPARIHNDPLRVHNDPLRVHNDHVRVDTDPVRVHNDPMRLHSGQIDPLRSVSENFHSGSHSDQYDLCGSLDGYSPHSLNNEYGHSPHSLHDDDYDINPFPDIEMYGLPATLHTKPEDTTVTKPSREGKSKNTKTHKVQQQKKVILPPIPAAKPHHKTRHKHQSGAIMDEERFSPDLQFRYSVFVETNTPEFDDPSGQDTSGDDVIIGESLRQTLKSSSESEKTKVAKSLKRASVKKKDIDQGDPPVTVDHKMAGPDVDKHAPRGKLSMDRQTNNTPKNSSQKSPNEHKELKPVSQAEADKNKEQNANVPNSGKHLSLVVTGRSCDDNNVDSKRTTQTSSPYKASSKQDNDMERLTGGVVGKGSGVPAFVPHPTEVSKKEALKDSTPSTESLSLPKDSLITTAIKEPLPSASQSAIDGRSDPTKPPDEIKSMLKNGGITKVHTVHRKSVQFGPELVRMVTKITYPWNEKASSSDSDSVFSDSTASVSSNDSGSVNSIDSVSVGSIDSDDDRTCGVSPDDLSQ